MTTPTRTVAVPLTCDERHCIHEGATRGCFALRRGAITGDAYCDAYHPTYLLSRDRDGRPLRCEACLRAEVK